jgi:hypothetical protein
MSEGPAELARRWRERAQKIRSVAEGMDDPTAQADLYLVATKWEVLASNADARTQSAKGSRRD